MQTALPISTISYNTEKFLKEVSDRLLSEKIISFYAFIYHKREDDEKKVHFHWYCEPTKRIQTEDLRDYFKEFDPEKPDKPRCCLPFQIVNRKDGFGNWYLYELHDSAYLLSKGQTRKYHYKRFQFFTSDDDYFDHLIRDIDYSRICPYVDIIKAQEEGFTFSEYLARGCVPMNQVTHYEKVWNSLIGLPADSTFRNGYKNHENKDNVIDFVINY